MNKRIQELVELCTTQYRDGHGEYVDQVDVEKFAEMLIQEVCFGMMNVHLDKDKISMVAKSWGVEVL